MTEESVVHVAIQFGSNNSQRRVGAAVRRRVGATWLIELFDFLDNEQFSSFDSFLIQIGRCFIFMVDESESGLSKSENRKISNILSDRDGIEVSYVKKALYFRKAEVGPALLKLIGSTTHNINVAEHERPFAYSCVDCLVQRLSLLHDEDSIGNYDLRLSSINAAMRLDSAAAEAVNLLPRPDHPSQFGSLFGVLNRCKTKMGSRMLERWLRQPLVDAVEINKRLDIVEALKENSGCRSRLVDGPLKGIPDLEAVVAKMQRKNAGLAEVYRLYSFCCAIPSFISVLADLADSIQVTETESSMAMIIREKFVNPLEKLVVTFGKYQKLVEHVIDMNALPDLVIDPSHNDQLQELKEERYEWAGRKHNF